MPRILPAGFVTPCQPTPVPMPPIGADWLREIKHDGFRLMVWRDGRSRAPIHPQWPRLGGGYPSIAAAAAALQARSFLIDGEAVVADARGVPSFNLLRSRTREAKYLCTRVQESAGRRRGGGSDTGWAQMPISEMAPVPPLS